MAGCRSGRPVVGTSDDRAAVPVIPVAPDSDMLSAAIADTENEVCPADSGDPESSERRRLYRRSAEPADYVSNVESYNPISFAFEYEPNVQGYRVEGRLFAFDTPQGLGNRLEGPCRLSFYNESTGCRYDIFCEHYCDENQFPGGMMKQGNMSSIRESERPKEHCVSITVHCKVRMVGGRLYSRMSISTARMKF